MQIAKSFVLHRIDVASFKKLPGLPPDKIRAAGQCIGSNVYSVAENILLMWLSHYYSQGIGLPAARVANFDSDLRDGVALACLLHAHWPFLSRLRSQVQDSPTQISEMESNAAAVLRMLEALHCQFRIDAKHILRPEPLNIIFFVAYLYQWLPQLIPQSEITFEGKLQQAQRRTVELSNPSSQSLSYNARLHGHDGFSLETTSVRLAPKSQGQVIIHCIPSTGVCQQAYLILESTREADAFAATLVFKLISKVCLKGLELFGRREILSQRVHKAESAG
jgi:Calponin homology (CH) domain